MVGATQQLLHVFKAPQQQARIIQLNLVLTCVAPGAGRTSMQAPITSSWVLAWYQSEWLRPRIMLHQAACEGHCASWTTGPSASAPRFWLEHSRLRCAANLLMSVQLGLRSSETAHAGAHTLDFDGLPQAMGLHCTSRSSVPKAACAAQDISMLSV